MRIGKYLFVAVSVILVAVWSISLFFDAFTPIGNSCVIEIMGGEFSMTVAEDPLISELDSHFRRCGWQKWGFSAPRLITYPGRSGFDATIPLWLPTSISIAATLYMFWRTRVMSLPGHCKGCSYDLTGNKTGICPECGLRFTNIHNDTNATSP